MEEKFKTIEKICSRQQNLDQKRLGKELILIKELDLTDDFYELYKTQKQGNENNVNSLVAYAIGITSKLPDSDFNPNKDISSARMSPPDIDLDFADIRRDEVIEYVANKYGHNKVAQIITFGTMAARAVIRDVGRVLDYNYGLCDKMAKMIPFGFTLDQTLKGVAEFKRAYDSDEKIKRLIDLAKKLEGVARHASTHACGIVISSEPLDNLVPLQRTTQDNDAVVTQYEMYSIEDLGLLKMDFL
ncbi:DNA polymerase III subunit alpha, partial [Patescibacteria group bacterium]|nr:DNA polymerase III subunit alpha [Patescibacteria group bacterium]